MSERPCFRPNAKGRYVADLARKTMASTRPMIRRVRDPARSPDTEMSPVRPWNVVERRPLGGIKANVTWPRLALLILAAWSLLTCGATMLLGWWALPTSAG